MPLLTDFQNQTSRLLGNPGFDDQWAWQWQPTRTNHDPSQLLTVETDLAFVSGIITDANRNWDTPYQDITITFSAAATDAALSGGGTATGHTISVNGVEQATTYRSGSGTATWVLRVATLCDADDLITYTYAPATGNTTEAGGQELSAIQAAPLSNTLTRRVRFILRDKNNALTASTTVSLLLLESITVGTTFPNKFDDRQFTTTPSTDSSALLDVQYTGARSVGATIYCAVLTPSASPTESFLWTTTVQ